MSTTEPNGGPYRTAAILQPLPAAQHLGFTEEQIAEIAGKWPRIGNIANLRGKIPYQIIFRAPKRAEYKRFRAQANEPARKHEAQEALARTIVVAVYWKGAPHIGEAAAREALDELLEEYPAAVDSSAASEVIERMMSGAVAEDQKE